MAELYILFISKEHTLQALYPYIFLSNWLVIQALIFSHAYWQFDGILGKPWESIPLFYIPC